MVVPFKDGGTRFVQGIYIPDIGADGRAKGFFVLGSDITERKQAEGALRQSEERLRLITENMSDTVWLMDMNLQTTFISPSVERLRGYSLEELQALPLDQQLTPPSLAHAMEAMARELTPERLADTNALISVMLELEFYRKDGSTFWSENNLTVIRNLDGQPVTILGIGRDITERKRAEEALHRYELLARHSRDIILFMRRDNGRILEANAAATNAYGYSREELLSLSISDLRSSETQSLVVDQMTEADARGILFETVHRRKDGHTFPVEVSSQGATMGGTRTLISVIRDITERKRVEEALRQSETRYRLLVDAIPNMSVHLFDQDHRFLIAGGEEITKGGFDKSLIEGRTLSEAYPDEVVSILEPLYDKALRGESSFFEQEYGDFVYHQSIIPVHDDQGRIYAGMVLSHNITGRKRAEEELQRAMQELKRSNADLEQFAYVASHDLQEPLRMVASYTQLLARRYHGKLDADADEFITYAMDGATRMQTLINDLLAYSRVGTRGKPFEPTDVAAVLQAVLANLAIAIRESGAVVTHAALPEVKADPSQFVQLLQNLIGNAVKFRSESPPQIHLGVERLPGEWRFSVRDNGVGIEPQYFQRIFAVFQRLHTQREYPGTGIGLAICKKIVERHGGRIWVDSQPGQGSTFYFTLPDGAQPSAVSSSS
jgi:PAS domain S-box-containing protein